MTKKTLGAVAVSTLALTLLTGCANITDQIAKQMAEGAINQATGGKVSMSEKDGNITFKDNEGNEAVMGGGDKRPASVPADMPSLPGANGFAWIGAKDAGLLTFSVATEFKTACDQMVVLLQGSGWAESKSGFNMEVEGTKTTMYEKTGYALTLTCSTNESDKMTLITLTKSTVDTKPDTSVSN